jgi:hypothetical protein
MDRAIILKNRNRILQGREFQIGQTLIIGKDVSEKIAEILIKQGTAEEKAIIHEQTPDDNGQTESGPGNDSGGRNGDRSVIRRRKNP